MALNNAAIASCLKTRVHQAHVPRRHPKHLLACELVLAGVLKEGILHCCRRRLKARRISHVQPSPSPPLLAVGTVFLFADNAGAGQDAAFVEAVTAVVHDNCTGANGGS